ncbi:MAG: hypothetical protein AAFR98_06150 [Pseudomonadota bacterium]
MDDRKEFVGLSAKVLEGHSFYEIIDDAYRFFRYQKPTDTGVCKSCCMYPRIERDFFNPKISELPLKYIQDWYFAAVDLEGLPKGIWGYLLPRILEVLAAEEEPSNIGIEVALKRFDTGNPENWNRNEWDVLERFRHAYIERELSRDVPAENEHFEYCLDDVLCMFGIAGWDLDDLIGQLRNAPDDKLVNRIWIDWCRNDLSWGSIWTSVFWEGNQEQRMREFYTSQEMKERIDRIFFTSSDAIVQKRASDVAYVIHHSKT